jgi:hypothetical protein
VGWVFISDDFYDHWKFEAAGPMGIALWTVGLAWCNRNRTDGQISATKAARLLNLKDGCEELCEHLVKCELWDRTETGFRVHDYEDYQLTAQQITQRSAAASAAKAEAGRRGGLATQAKRRLLEAPLDQPASKAEADTKPLSQSLEIFNPPPTPSQNGADHAPGEVAPQQDQGRDLAPLVERLDKLCCGSSRKLITIGSVLVVRWAAQSLDSRSVDEIIGQAETWPTRPWLPWAICSALQKRAKEVGRPLPDFVPPKTKAATKGPQKVLAVT